MSSVEPHSSPSSAADTPGPVLPPAERTPSFRRPLRICHVAYTFYENDNRVRRYSEALAEKSHHVDVIALRRKGQKRTENVGRIRLQRIQHRAVTEQHPLVHLAKLLVFFANAAAVLTARHLRNPYDVVHVHNVPDFLVFTALVPKLLGAQIILDIHDALPELYAHKFRSGLVLERCLRWVERASCRFADHVLIANDIWRDRLIRRSTRPEKCTTVLNYPDLRLFSPRSEAAGASTGRFVLLYPGSLNRHQGVDVAIRAMALLRPHLPEAELHIYGEGAGRPELIRLTVDLGIADVVRFQAPVPLEEMAVVMATVDVGIEPKRAEGFADEALSTKIFEFMASGVPVVASRTTAHSRYFDDTVVRFFSPGDSAALASAVIDVHKFRDSRSQWTATAYAFAATFSWQHRAVDYFNILTSLMGGRTAPRGRKR